MTQRRRGLMHVSLACLLLLLLPACESGPLWWFVKGTTTNSSLRAMESLGGGETARWRAGSGSSTNACQKQTTTTPGGWLPNGSYGTPAYYENYPGQLITGPAIRLTDMACEPGSGIIRDELFIHSSYPWSSSRYASHGCIKVLNTNGPSPASGHIGLYAMERG